METPAFDAWISGLDFAHWSEGRHQIRAPEFLQRRLAEGAVLLDVRDDQEAALLQLPFALHIPIQELPRRFEEVPADRLVATFCSGEARAAVAYAYLQVKGRRNVRVLLGGYADLTEALTPGKIRKRRET